MKGEPTGFWAKLNQGEDGNILEWHPLMAHSADVAAVTETLLNKTILNQRVAALIGWEKLSEAQIARLSALAAIHDAGKVNHGFQNKMHKSKQPQAGHVTPIIELLGADDKYVDKFLLPLKIDIILQWFSDPHKAVQFLFATWGHHGRPVPIQHHFKATLWEENAVRNPQNGLKELGKALQQWFPKAFDEEIEPFPSDPVFQHTFNGLLTLADWLGSDPKFFEFAEYDDNYIKIARKNAEYAVEKLALDPKKPRKQLGSNPIQFNRIADFKPFEIQQ